MHVTGDIIYIPDPYFGSTLAPNAHCHIQREVTSEHIYTNDLGWRENAAAQKATERDIAFIGCSWPMGVGVQSKYCFAQKTAHNLKKNVANLGVGSYSLIQAIRRLENNIDTIKPKVVILSYGHWLVNRCFKSNAMGGIIIRPIYKQNQDGFLQIVNPSNPSIRDFNRYVTLHRKDRLNFFETLEFKILGFRINLQIRHYGLQKLRGFRYIHGSSDARFFKYRQYVLKQEAKRLVELCEQHNTKLLIFHLSPYVMKNEQDCFEIKQDDAFWKSIKTEYPHVHYEPPDTMDGLIQSLVKKFGNQRNLLDEIHCPDNNHPNEKGHQLIADAIIKSIKKNELM